MLLCPLCHAQLSDPELESGKCLSCGAAVAVTPQGSHLEDVDPHDDEEPQDVADEQDSSQRPTISDDSDVEEFARHWNEADDLEVADVDEEQAGDGDSVPETPSTRHGLKASSLPTVDENALPEDFAEADDVEEGQAKASSLPTVDEDAVDALDQAAEDDAADQESNQRESGFMETLDSHDSVSLREQLAGQPTIEDDSLDEDGSGTRPTIDSSDFEIDVDQAGARATIDSHDSASQDSEEADLAHALGDMDGDTDRATRTLDDGSADSVDPLDSADVDATLDSVGSVDEEDGRGSTHATVDSVDLEQNVRDSAPTIGLPGEAGSDSEDIHAKPTLESGDKPGTVSERRRGATLDSNDLSSRDQRRMREMWGSAAEDARPDMTIKERSAEADQLKSNLVIQPRAFVRSDPAEPRLPTADYELLGRLGRGGMAVVYQARQTSIDRNVAVKMLKKDLADDPRMRQKFLSEAVVTGDLEHPNIVPIYELGSNNRGALFYSMKEVKGTRWLDVIRENGTAENLDVLMKVCDAVAFAHSRGVIHRDLKPENVMLGDFGEVLVMDWGLAVATTDYTKSGNIAQICSMGGTPAYMAPEMAAGHVEKIGPASDIYLLGAMLYETITGKPPHAGRSTMKCLFNAAQNRIQPTDKRGELLDIAMRAMSTRAENRYRTVADFQAAIRLYESHSESISLCRRAEDDVKQATESGDYAAYARATFGFEEAIELWSGNRRASRGLSDSRSKYATAALEKDDLDLAASVLDSEDANHRELLEKVAVAQRERTARASRLRAAKRAVWTLVATVLVVITGAMIWILDAKRDAENSYAKAVTEREKAIRAKSEEEKERKKAVAAQEAERKLREEAVTLKSQAEMDRDAATEAEATAQEQRRLAEAAQDQAEYEEYVAMIGSIYAQIEDNSFAAARTGLEKCEEEHRNWEWGRLYFQTQRDVQTIPIAGLPTAIAYDPNAQLWAVGTEAGAVEIRNAQGEVQRTIEQGDQLIITRIAFSPDGQSLATACTSEESGESRGWLRSWDVNTGQQQHEFSGHVRGITSVAYSPEGTQLVSGSFDGTVRVWDVADAKLTQTLRGHRDWVWDVQFDQRGKQLVSAGHDGAVVVWKLENDQFRAQPTFDGHRGPVFRARFSPAGEHVASAGYDGRVLYWSVRELKEFDFDTAILNEGRAPEDRDPLPSTQFQEFRGHEGPVRCLAFSDSGDKILSGGQDNSVIIWRIGQSKPFARLRGHGGWVVDCALSTDKDLVLTASRDGRVKQWSLESYKMASVLDTRPLLGHSGAILKADIHADSNQIVTAGRDRSIMVWSKDNPDQHRILREGHAYLVSRAEILPDGKRLLTAGVDNSVRIWSLLHGGEVMHFPDTGIGAAAAASADGRWVATGRRPNAEKVHSITLWDAQSGKQIAILGAHRSQITALAFSANSQWIMAGDAGGRCSLWNLQDQAWVEKPVEQRHNLRITDVVFSDTMGCFFTSSDDRMVACWDPASGERTAKFSHDAAVADIDVTGSILLSGCIDGSVRWWNLKEETPKANRFDPVAGEAVSSVDLNTDGTMAMIVLSEQRRAMLWDLSSNQELKFAAEDGSQDSLLRFGEQDLLWAATFTPDGKHVVTVGGDAARLFTVPQPGEAVAETMVFRPHGPVTAAGFSPDGKRVVSASFDGTLRIWDIAEGRVLRTVHGLHKDSILDAVFSPDGNRILTGSADGTACICDAETGEVRQRFEHQAAVRRVAFSQTGDQVLTASDDRFAAIWDSATGARIHQLQGHTDKVTCVAISRDGSLVVTGSRDGEARVWKAGTGELVGVLQGHSAPVTSVDVSEDNSRVLTGSEDLTAKIWDTSKLREVLTLKGHEKGVTSVRFEPKGTSVLTASLDGTAILWPAAPWQSRRPLAE